MNHSALLAQILSYYYLSVDLLRFNAEQSSLGKRLCYPLLDKGTVLIIYMQLFNFSSRLLGCVMYSQALYPFCQGLNVNLCNGMQINPYYISIWNTLVEPEFHVYPNKVFPYLLSNCLSFTIKFRVTCLSACWTLNLCSHTVKASHAKGKNFCSLALFSNFFPTSLF